MKTPQGAQICLFTCLSLMISLGGWQPLSFAQVSPTAPKLMEPSESDRAFERGLQQLRARNYENAIASFDQAIRLDPKFKEAYSGRGFAQLQSGQLAQAMESYNRILQIDPTAAIAYSGLALVRAKLGDDRQAKLDTEKSAALLARQTSRHLYQSELSLLELRVATAGQPPNSQLWTLIEQGYQQIDARNFRAAINLFNQAVKLLPSGSARPYIDRGVAYFWMQDYRAAIEDFSTAIRFNPFYVKAYEYRARAYEQIGQNQAARADTQKAIRLARQFGSQPFIQELTQGNSPTKLTAN
ncbi:MULTISPECIES: tetratricopeptide repeat protein [Leptolyngbya]|uniref:Tetratricopeptide repeat protein n=1 Tax=Leptolyngbya boryana CZ1 TaxID=3060204 RepID=A0AA97AL44_LEPBY|nr:MULTISPECIES: tetratricopeptide repeat protein [Leptolyngbya]MCY6490492.1 tetratricopeptide repeat protein [Leptolyngbya sp. GGD]WNZ43733.1 tetratricopeptide repeat protein [Leptolyngbya boryana CZ1]